MKKVKRTPVPLPGTAQKTTKLSSRPAPKSTQLSTEFVESSEDSSTEAATRSSGVAKPPQEKTRVNIGIHAPNGVIKKTPKQTHVPLPQPTNKSSNDQREVSSSESIESNRDSASSAGKHAQRKQNTTSGEESSESDSSSDTSTESSDDESCSPATQTIGTIQSRPVEPRIVEPRPPQPYAPPHGFAAMPLPLYASSSNSNIFENLSGKQVWHITAPSGVPLSQIRQLALDKALEGEPVTKHDGMEYGFSAQGIEGGKRDILIPHHRGFKPAGVQVSRTLHLQQIVSLPKLSSKQADPNTGSEAASSITRSTIRAPRPQVKGLRMRFLPSGFGAEEPGTIGMSDSDTEAPAPAGLGIPNGNGVLAKSKKRKHEHADGEEKSKHKKHKPPEERERRREERKEKKRHKDSAKTKS
ncbi:hypothetical protein EJ04DRAFT_574259 [Polyplosphaeria fusca]|uniref:Uncharacterized protein n=1 Tax=Polyplosphaeria fusca TaxID=682080 RepID=A0A9P4V733_9PLEO|nr:hypothetical protein EJ04DRAFT_574259 [Polyplosphaeria fusca]